MSDLNPTQELLEAQATLAEADRIRIEAVRKMEIARKKMEDCPWMAAEVSAGAALDYGKQVLGEPTDDWVRDILNFCVCPPGMDKPVKGYHLGEQYEYRMNGPKGGQFKICVKNNKVTAIRPVEAAKPVTRRETQ